MVKFSLRAIFYWLPFALLSAIKYIALAIGFVLKAIISPLTLAYRVVYSRVEPGYSRALPWVLDHRLTTLGLALAMFCSAVLLYPRLGMELIPEMSQNEIQVALKMPVGTPVEQTEKTLARMQKITAAYPEIRLVYTSAGLSSIGGGGLKEEREDIGQMNIG